MRPRKKQVDIFGTIEQAIEKESPTPDETTLKEGEHYQNTSITDDIQLEKLATLKHHNSILEQNKIERKKYAKHIFILTCSWAVLIFCVIFFTGFKLIQLSDKVLITLITSTTINFFGFFLLVVKYLFNTSTDKNSITKTKKKVIDKKHG